MDKDIPNDKQELLKLLETSTEKAKKGDILVKLSSLTRSSDPDEALELAERALEISESVGYTLGSARSLMAMGIVHQYRSNYAKALEYYHGASEKYKDAEFREGIPGCLNNIGIVYQEQGDHSRALEYYQKSLNLYEELDNKPGISSCLTNIGNVYLCQHNFSQALKYYEESLDIKHELDDRAGIAHILNNLGSVHEEQENYEEALRYYLKSLEIREEIKDKIGVSYCRENIGKVYMFQGALSRAHEYYGEALKINEELGDKSGLASCYLNFGRLLQREEDWKKALDFFTKGLNYAIEIGSLDLKRDAYELLSETYEELGDTSKALKYYKFYKKANDSLFGKEQTRKITQLETRYELEKKEHELEIWKKASVTDTLTQIANRQGIWQSIRDDMERVKDSGEPITFALVDIDGFKKFNDVHGHDCGDSVLITVAKILSETVRDDGHVGRWGGEEFIIVLPQTPVEQGKIIIEKVRRNIEKHIHCYEAKELSITASFGISEYHRGDDIDTAIKLADDALYCAKETGKNRYVVSCS